MLWGVWDGGEFYSLFCFVFVRVGESRATRLMIALGFCPRTYVDMLTNKHSNCFSGVAENAQ